MHYAHFKQYNPLLLKALIETFPFATIIANGIDSPVVAYAPLIFKQDGENGAVEFHLAQENPVSQYLTNGAKITIVLNGSSAHISPSWYTARFSGDNPDRSKTAPTYNYISTTLNGSVQIMDAQHLINQIKDLVKAHEPSDGWKIEEIDHDMFGKWCGLITGFRVNIESFDMTVKLSQEQTPEDKPGIIAGLKKRGMAGDMTMARLLEVFDGTAESLIRGLSQCQK